MFKLYFNYNGWHKTKYDFSYEKENGEYDFTLRFYMLDQLVETMKYIANKHHIYYFMIVERIENTDIRTTTLRSEEDFNEFILHYNDSKVNYEDLSCIELKRLILEKQNSIK